MRCFFDVNESWEGDMGGPEHRNTAKKFNEHRNGRNTVTAAIIFSYINFNVYT